MAERTEEPVDEERYEEPPGGDGAVGATPGPPGQTTGEELPDLLSLDLEELRRLDHPVLVDLLADLRHGRDGAGEMFWGFTRAF
ncbi:hypothetical protein [Streptomyces jeddahensis]|uniref:FXSXX-COOH protein n=1 Tax=Streptomyces jeddahensis TaxID=1716141 RepID=A0A177HS86_9ACTN|nr:hypothetical protein [Streptomyces jeddahensis]OAH13520.1 hypothetical protein STSP_31980 [Streptomyces jeddahensis]